MPTVDVQSKTSSSAEVRPVAIKAGRVDEIIDAAARLFGDRGYHATSVRDLAGAVNMQGGSLYAHFTGKEEVLAAIVSRAAAAFRAALEPIARSDGPVTERLAAALEAHIAIIAADPGAAAVYFQDWRHLTGARFEQAKAERDSYEVLWRGMIREGVASGELRAEDPDLAAVAWLSVGNWAHQWYRPGGRLSAAQIGERLGAMLLDGMSIAQRSQGRDR